MLVEAFAGGVEELRMMGFVCTEFGEAGERRGLEVVGGDFFGSRVSRKNEGKGKREEGRERIGIVLER